MASDDKDQENEQKLAKALKQEAMDKAANPKDGLGKILGKISGKGGKDG